MGIDILITGICGSGAKAGASSVARMVRISIHTFKRAAQCCAFRIAHGRHQSTGDLEKLSFNGPVKNLVCIGDRNTAGTTTVTENVLSNGLEFGAVLNFSDSLCLTLYDACGANDRHDNEYDNNDCDKCKKSFHTNNLFLLKYPETGYFYYTDLVSYCQGGVLYL